MGAFDAPILYDKAVYIETDAGNKVSRKALIQGASSIVLGGKSIIQSGAILRGDLRRSSSTSHPVISMGRYCNVGENAVIRPPGKMYKGQFTMYPVRLSDFVIIGKDSIIEAAQIGHGVEIGEGSVIGPFVIIKDLAIIKPGTVLPEGVTVPSMSIWAGNPGKMIGTLPETHQETIEAECRSFYQRFRPG